MRFTKMQGLGNDFVLIDARESAVDFAHLAQEVCDRHFGIGADGLMVVLPSEAADCRMRIFNSDGSEPEMCGNGLRCFARFIYEEGIVPKRQMTVETLAGIMVPEILPEDDLVVVDMGEPVLERSLIPMLGAGGSVIGESITVNGMDFTVTAVSMGNPHCVIFTDDIEKVPLEEWGAAIERCEYFPQKTNVEFVQVLNPQELRMRVWERGAGITMACGTGACATAVAGVLNEKSSREVTIHLDGGDLTVIWQEDNHLLMRGPAKKVFVGEWLKQ